MDGMTASVLHDHLCSWQLGTVILELLNYNRNHNPIILYTGIGKC